MECGGWKRRRRDRVRDRNVEEEKERRDRVRDGNMEEETEREVG